MMNNFVNQVEMMQDDRIAIQNALVLRAQQGDMRAKDQLCSSLLGWLKSCVSQKHFSSAYFDDAVNQAWLGVEAALKGYRQSEFGFIPYAKKFVDGELSKFSFLTKCSCKVSKRLYHKKIKLDSLIANLKTAGLDYSYETLAEILHWDIKDVARIDSLILNPIVSFDDARNEMSDDLVSDSDWSFDETLGSFGSDLKQAFEKTVLYQLVKQSPAKCDRKFLQTKKNEAQRVANIIDRYYGITCQQQASGLIAIEFGLTPERIRQIVRQWQFVLGNVARGCEGMAMCAA